MSLFYFCVIAQKYIYTLRQLLRISKYKIVFTWHDGIV